jgi:hypothetical protein
LIFQLNRDELEDSSHSDQYDDLKVLHGGRNVRLQSLRGCQTYIDSSASAMTASLFHLAALTAKIQY